MLKNRRVNKLLFKKAAFPMVDMMPLLKEWFDTSPGIELLKQEQQCLDEHLPFLFGYHLLQFGVQDHVPLFTSSKVGHKFIVSPRAGNQVGAIVDEDLIPFTTESLDVVLLHHLLEYSQQPHQVLNEMARTVVPSGHIIIVGMNPYSFIGIWSLLGRFRGKTVWNNRLLAMPRVVDWLTLLGFRLQSVHYGYYKPPLVKRCMKPCTLMERLLRFCQLPLGGFYIVIAKKEVSTITPIKTKRFRNAQSIIPIMEPSLYTPPNDKNISKQHD